MPYGIDKNKGGDSPENVRFVESCVKKVQLRTNKRTGKRFTKSEAIAVCKSQLSKSKGRAAQAWQYLDLVLDALAEKE